jgi:hypothetical protein
MFSEFKIGLNDILEIKEFWTLGLEIQFNYRENICIEF